MTIRTMFGNVVVILFQASQPPLANVKTFDITEQNHKADVHNFPKINGVRSLGALRAQTSRRRPFKPLDFALSTPLVFRSCEEVVIMQLM